jgi:site-specific DNA-methyltransferase (adenine-specific)
LNIGKAVDKIEGNDREVGKLKFKGGTQLGVINDDNWKPKDVYESKGNTEWEGWGTALKPAHEPIVMARKPLSEKTVVDNVLEWGTGGINIDGCRIETDDNLGGGATNGSVLSVEGFDRPWMHDEKKMKEFSDKMKEKVEHAQTLGRFPANIILDEEAGKLLDEQTGIIKTGDVKPYKSNSNSSIYGDNRFFKKTQLKTSNFKGDTGGASRFFYCPKTSKKDRNEGCENSEPKNNFHPTVKPTDLMLYLIRLVTPKGGVTLDPFMGSGSTGKAAIRGGFDFVGIEREKEYFEIAEARIQHEIDNPYKEETKTRTEVKEVVDKFFSF